MRLSYAEDTNPFAGKQIQHEYFHVLSAKCVIQLFKHDLTQLSPDSSRTKEPKIKYELQFVRSDFCGIEKGEHYDRHGIRRYFTASNTIF